VRQSWVIGIRYFAVSRPSGDQGRGRPTAAGDYQQSLYNLSVVGRVERKRKVLDAWAIELRRIIGEPAAVELLAA